MIFISYRTSDAEDLVSRLDNDLSQHLGEDAVFRDRTRITPGADWTEVLEFNARNRPVMLAVIGPRWQKATHEEGNWEGVPRLWNPDDWVRKEITFALEERRTLIPVLVNGTHMPPPGWLEGCQLGGLGRAQAIELRSDSYDYDFARLLETLRAECPGLFVAADPPASALAADPAAMGMAPGDEWLAPYLEWVVAMHRTLELPGVRGASRLPVRLEQVFVALRGDRAGAYEIARSQELLEDDLARMHGAYHDLPDAERRWVRACLLRENPYMLSLLERDRPSPQAGAAHTIPVTLAEAFRDERWLVILGDPGSGKTTLGRWIALKLARAVLDGQTEQVRVPAYQVNPETPYDRRPVELGPPRLPILVRVAKFAHAIARARERGEVAPLIDWLCEVTWNEQPPTAGHRIPRSGLDALFRAFLKDGRAVLILDGLDEITEAVDRADVVRAVEQFVRDWIPAPGGVELGSRRTAVPAGPPHAVGGNQLVVTSRIAGYHAAPLTVATMTHVTIEPMRRPAVEHFCEMWMQAVHELLEPALPPEERSRRAHAMANGLRRAILDPERPGVEEIASNPLLVTILSSLYLKRGADLPETRVELYQTAIEMLLEDWRDTGLSLEETLYVLDPLAAYIHERYPTGLVEENELRAVITQHLAEYRGLSAENPPPRMAADVRMFVETLRDRVGLIASRGERLYGFLHLTFQEHLAGRRLVRNPQTAADDILPHMSDPRWREPILLALGYAVWKWTPAQRGDLLSRLLSADDPLGAFLPRSALFIVDALSDMAKVPEASFRLLVRRLLSAYADRETGQRFPLLRTRIEEAFLRLRRMGRHDWMDEVLAGAIRAPAAEDPAGVALACASATLVREHEWFSPTIVEALVDGLENDSPLWGWPIEGSLRDLVSPEQPRPVGTPVAPDANLHDARDALRTLESEPDGDQKEARRNLLLKQLDGAQAELQQAQREEPREFGRAVAHYRVAVAAQNREQLRESLRERTALPGADLLLRRALVREGPLRERVVGDLHWLMVIAGVGGGYPNCQSAEIEAEYREIALFLQKSSAERDQIIDADPDVYVGRFGNEDAVRRAAVYLDNKMDGRMDIASAPVAFSPEAIHRNSRLDADIVQALREGREARDLAPVFRRLWREEAGVRARADALTARVALGEDVVPELAADLRRTDRAVLTEAVLAQVERTAGFLEDAVTRARTAVLGTLEALDEADPEVWIDVVDTLLATVGAGLAQALPYPLLAKAPERYVPVLRADMFCTRCNLTDDRVYGAAVALDEIPEADAFTALLLHAHRAPTQRRGRLSFRWEVEPVPPRLEPDEPDVPLEVLNALSTVHLGSIRPEFENEFFETAVGKFADRATRNPALVPELVAFSLSFGAFEVASRLSLFQPGGRAMSAAIRRIADPYHRARGWMAILRFVTGAPREAAFTRARAAALAISDPHRRTRVLEVLLTQTTGVDGADLHDAAVAAAREVADPDNRCRALVRLARSSPESRGIELWMQALQAAAGIASEVERANTLQVLEPFVPADQGVESEWTRVVETLSHPRLRARATNTLGLWLLREPPASLAGFIDANPQRWAPVLLAAALRDVLDKFQPDRTLIGVWTALASEPGSHRLAAEIAERGAEAGLTATREAALAVEALIRAGETESLRLLLPLLQAPALSAIPIVERWRAQPDVFTAHHATLLLAEDGRKITEHTLPGLVWCLADGPDRSHARAWLVLCSRIWAVEVIRPQLSDARLGRRVVEALTRLFLEFRDRDMRVSRAFTAMTADQLHDDADAFRDWIVRAAGEGRDADIARQILGDCVHLDDAVWRNLLDGLASGPPPARRALIRSACMNLSMSRRLSPERRASLLRVLEQMSSEPFRAIRVFPDLESKLVDALLADHSAAGYETPGASAQAANRRLEDGAMVLADVLATERDTALLGALGELGARFFSLLDGSDPSAEIAAQRVVEAPEAFPVLVEWLTQKLEADEPESEWFSITGALLRITATVAQRMPTAFVKAADTRRLEPLLAHAASHERGTYARRSAILLLSHLRHVSVRVVRAMLFALRDDRHVQEAAFQVAGRFLEFRPDALALLIRALRDDSSVVAWGAARILSSICRNERIEPRQRTEILDAMAACVRERMSHRGLYRFIGSGDAEDKPVSIGYFGRLDRALYDSILEITGVVPGTAVPNA